MHECVVCRQVKTQRQELAIAICNTPSMAGQEVDAELQRTTESKNDRIPRESEGVLTERDCSRSREARDDGDVEETR